MIGRRGFLQACLALSAAPAIVRAESLMPVVFRAPKFGYITLGDLPLDAFGNAVPAFTVEGYAIGSRQVIGTVRMASQILRFGGIEERVSAQYHGRKDGGSSFDVVYSYTAKDIALAAPPGFVVKSVLANGRLIPFRMEGA